MEQKKEQQNKQPLMRYNEQELALIKSIFDENLDILFALRKVFLHADLSDADENILKLITENKQAVKLIEKTYLPRIELDCPFGQTIDLWLAIEVVDNDPEATTLSLKVREKLISYIDTGLKRLTSFDKKPKLNILNFSPNFDVSDEERYIELQARNALIKHTEVQLQQLIALSKMKRETLAELEARMKKDSTK